MHAANHCASWQNLHEALVAFGRARSIRERELGRLLLAAERLALHRHFGHASLYEYAERVLGLSPRKTRECLRVAHALEALPLLDAALAAADILPAAARELTRVATAVTEAAWLAAAKDKTVREIEAMVSGRLPGDLPDTPARPGAVQHVLRFEVSGDTFELFREAADTLCRQAARHLDHDALIAEIARRALGEQRPGAKAVRAPARAKGSEVRERETGARGEQRATEDDERATSNEEPGARSREQGTSAGAATHVGDGQRAAGERREGPGQRAAGERRVGDGTRAAGERRVDDVSRAAGGRSGGDMSRAAGEPLAGDASRAAGEPDARPATGADRATHAGHGAGRGAKVAPSLPRHIPAAARRQAMARTGSRCAAPGCRHRIWVAVHHLDPRAEGGTHDPARLAPLCPAHHRAHHRGALLIDGDPHTGLHFFHADGTAYGSTTSVSPAALERGQDAFATLRRLGFTESRAHRLVAAARERLGPGAEFADLVREALVLS